MLGTFFSTLLRESADDSAASRRRFDRRSCDRCVSVIGGRIYPVDNWSLGGLQIYGDPRPFGINEEIDVTLKFKLRSNIVAVPNKARVVRKAHDRVAFEFLPISHQIRKRFQSVVDDFVATEFADSQLV
jgi:hypothetical protein